MKKEPKEKLENLIVSDRALSAEEILFRFKEKGYIEKWIEGEPSIHFAAVKHGKWKLTEIYINGRYLLSI